MGFREDVPLHDFTHSLAFLQEARGVEWSCSGTSSLGVFGVPEPPPLVPQRAGEGAVSRSTCLELDPWPSVVWDVNGYYHALGVGFRATRRELLAGYLRLEGQDDDYLTYVFKQLLDPQIRASYDSAPLGSRFFDRYVEEELRRRAQELARCWDTTPEAVLERWGFQVVPPADDDPQIDGEQDEIEVDIPQESGEDEVTSPAERPEPWPYSYYVWGRQPHHPGIAEVMRLWQEAIAAECQRRRVAVRFAVGLVGEQEDSRFLISSVDGARVAFLSVRHTDEIDDIAPHAATRLIHLRD